MELKTQALCLNAADYKDNDKLLTLASLEYGKITARIRSVKSPKSKLKMAAAPLCFGEYILTKHSDFYTVIGCSVEDNFFACWEDLHRYTASQIILEILDKSLYETAEGKEEILAAVKALAAVNYNEATPYIYAVWFILHILPALTVDIFSAELPADTAVFLKSVERSDLRELDALNADGAALLKGLTYLQMILKNTLSEKIRSIGEAVKILQ